MTDYCTADPRTSILPVGLRPFLERIADFYFPLDHQTVAQKIRNNAKLPTPPIVHSFILSCLSARRMEWIGGACVCVNGTGVDMLLFTDCGEYVENERQNAFHNNWKKKKIENRIK